MLSVVGNLTMENTQMHKSWEPRHTIFRIQELLVFWKITLYFGFIRPRVPENKIDLVK